MSTPSSVKWCLLAACVLCGAARSFAAEDDAVAAGAEPRQGGWLCTPADSAGVCLFKGVLKNVLSYASSRRRDAAVGAPGPVGGTDVQAQPKGIEEFLAEQIQNVFGMFSFGFDLPAEVTAPWTLLKSSFFNGKRIEALARRSSDTQRRPLGEAQFGIGYSVSRLIRCL